MIKPNADKAAKQASISGFRHHPYELEQMLMRALANGDRSLLQRNMNLSLYSDVLAPQPFRAMKNSAICMVAIICRTVINIGVDVERSFFISDYYVNEIENQTDKSSLEAVVLEMLNQYMDDIQNKQSGTYSLHVARSIRYIRQHLYAPCRASSIAKAVGLHPAYLSSLFKAETGIEISRYIRDMKLEEARSLLQQTGYSVTEIAEMLGYCDAAYFSNQFKAKYGKSPKKLI